MPENKSRFVLLCQQSLALAVVVAIAAPAANTVTLDIVAPARPGTPGSVAPAAPATDSAATGTVGGGDSPSLVASAPVKPRVTAVPLGGVSKAGLAALREGTSAMRGGAAATARLVAAEGDPETDDLAVLSAPQSVDSLATVGVTWKHGENLPEDAITVSVRTEKNGTWSAWQNMPYHDEHGPDAGSDESARNRPGTDPVYVGHVDDVQIKAVTASGEAPDGMQLAMVDPGAQAAAKVEKPAIDTGTLDLSAADTTTTTDPATDPTTTDPATTDPTATGNGDAIDPAADGADGTTDGTTGGDASLAAGAVTAKPMIYSRAQWGADERMRDKSSLHYGEVHAGFVHHTVNANNYTAAQVPAIIRGIYAYHTQSRGWSDVGYNFLVDRFGRIWEGRYGGVDRPVVGAHTLGYNDDAFAMSAIGNYETAQPSAATIDAYGRLFAWKLSLHGVSAGSMKQWVTKRYLHAINGHRDVGQTACPGKYLYAQIPKIRALAVAYQKSFASRRLSQNLAGTARPDVVLRDRNTKQGYVLRTGGGSGFAAGTVAASGLAGADLVTAVGDVTGDGRGDVLARNRATKSTAVYPGAGSGRYSAPVKSSTRFAKLDALTGVGDWNGDGKPDVVGRNATTHRLYVYYGDGAGLFGATLPPARLRLERLLVHRRRRRPQRGRPPRPAGEGRREQALAGRGHRQPSRRREPALVGLVRLRPDRGPVRRHRRRPPGRGGPGPVDQAGLGAPGQRRRRSGRPRGPLHRVLRRQPAALRRPGLRVGRDGPGRAGLERTPAGLLRRRRERAHAGADGPDLPRLEPAAQRRRLERRRQG